MAARPQNIGIKAIEIYFPSQVGGSLAKLVPSEVALRQVPAQD